MRLQRNYIKQGHWLKKRRAQQTYRYTENAVSSERVRWSGESGEAVPQWPLARAERKVRSPQIHDVCGLHQGVAAVGEAVDHGRMGLWCPSGVAPSANGELHRSSSAAQTLKLRLGRCAESAAACGPAHLPAIGLEFTHAATCLHSFLGEEPVCNGRVVASKEAGLRQRPPCGASCDA